MALACERSCRLLSLDTESFYMYALTTTVAYQNVKRRIIIFFDTLNARLCVGLISSFTLSPESIHINELELKFDMTTVLHLFCAWFLEI